MRMANRSITLVPRRRVCRVQTEHQEGEGRNLTVNEVNMVAGVGLASVVHNIRFIFKVYRKWAQKWMMFDGQLLFGEIYLAEVEGHWVRICKVV